MEAIIKKNPDVRIVHNLWNDHKNKLKIVCLGPIAAESVLLYDYLIERNVRYMNVLWSVYK